ncbi:TPA: 30S ribosomal protein S20 [bacterium]|nr:30S ribosomal protein S20 [bacterium]
MPVRIKKRSRSVLKAIRQNEKRRERNRAVKKEIKAHIKKTKKAIVSNEKDLALENLRLATKKIDKAAKKKILHKNKANRLKSKLAKKVAEIV